LMSPSKWVQKMFGLLIAKACLKAGGALQVRHLTCLSLGQ
jgi:hypothetical protein